MYRFAYFFVLTLFIISLSYRVFAGRDETCTMDDKTHKAHYHCPEGFEVVYTGEGEQECDGSCYKSGDSSSLQSAIGMLLIRRGVNPVKYSKQMFVTTEKLLKTNEAQLSTDVSVFKFRLRAP